MRVAVGQMCSYRTHAANIETMTALAARADAAGADLLCLPEVAGLCDRRADAAAPNIVPPADDPFLAACRAAAARHRIWMQPGSTPVRGTEKFRNHAALISPAGEIVATYDKIHLFDVALEGKKPIGESRRFEPGDILALVDTPLARFGMTICYDLRFPALYGTLAQAGAEVVFVPSAFTMPTGRAHWKTLIRARAIETGAYIVAAAQAGRHEDGRETWGHSLIVDPWGKVLMELGGDGPDFGVTDLDLDAVSKARSQIPVLGNARAFRLKRFQG